MLLNRKGAGQLTMQVSLHPGFRDHFPCRGQAGTPVCALWRAQIEQGKSKRTVPRTGDFWARRRGLEIQAGATMKLESVPQVEKHPHSSVWVGVTSWCSMKPTNYCWPIIFYEFEKERGREKQRDTDRLTDRQTGRDRQRDRDRDRGKERKGERERERFPPPHEVLS